MNGPAVIPSEPIVKWGHKKTSSKNSTPAPTWVNYVNPAWFGRGTYRYNSLEFEQNTYTVICNPLKGILIYTGYL